MLEEISFVISENRRVILVIYSIVIFSVKYIGKTLMIFTPSNTQIASVLLFIEVDIHINGHV